MDHMIDAGDVTKAHILPRRKIRYINRKELGGLRRPVKNSVNTFWRNASFRGFARFAPYPFIFLDAV